MIKIRRSKNGRIAQGDIYRDIEFIEYITEKKGNIEVSKIVFPLVVVLTQDCDLAQDNKFRFSRDETENEDKILLSVLVAPLYNAEHLFNGEHLSEIEMEMQKINKNKSPGKSLKNNESPRYHYISFPVESGIVPSIVDFKHYFSVNVEILKKMRKTNFICGLAPLYRESLTNRYSAFLGRIGLPLPTAKG